MDFLIILTITILAVLFFYQFVTQSVVQSTRRFVSEHSIAIRNLRELNGRYCFYGISMLDVAECYDNEHYYETVSPQDCLIARLTVDEFKSAVLRAMEQVGFNQMLYCRYTEEAEGIRHLGNYDAEPQWFHRWKLEEVEACIFQSLLQTPIVELLIPVEVRLTTINGYHCTSKYERFAQRQICELMMRVEQKNGHYYTDRAIWDALARVERARVTNRMRFAVYQRDGNRCKRCGRTEQLEIDHIVPIARGGKSVLDNLQTLCHDCNVSKSDHIDVCPVCGASLVLCHGRYGEFYGCTAYPKCSFTTHKK